MIDTILTESPKTLFFTRKYGWFYGTLEAYRIVLDTQESHFRDADCIECELMIVVLEKKRSHSGQYRVPEWTLSSSIALSRAMLKATPSW